VKSVKVIKEEKIIVILIYVRSLMGVQCDFRAPSVAQSYGGQASFNRPAVKSSTPSRPPSVAGSDTGYRNGRSSAGGVRSSPAGAAAGMSSGGRGGGGGGGRSSSRQPFYVPPNRPGSVTGSIEGRLASSGRGRGGSMNLSRQAANNSMQVKSTCIKLQMKLYFNFCSK